MTTVSIAERQTNVDLVEAIADAHEAVQDATSPVLPTDLFYSERLSDLHEADVWVASELGQRTGAYKIRGAFNRMRLLSDEESEAGVVAASAGNHAQAVALCAASLGVRAAIFMPENTPQNKVDRTEYFGGSFVEVHLAGRTFDDAYAASVQFQQKRDAVFVHPFDDAAVIAGQGTLGIEIAEQVSPDMLVAPVGGGGLLSGVGIAVRDKYPEVELYGAEPAGAASLRHALNLGRVAALQEIDTFVDGAAVKQEGEQTFAILSQLGVQSVGVANEQTRRAVTDHWEQDGLRVELAGGLATAALEQLPREQKIGKTIVLIASGGCLSLDRYEAEVKLQ